MLLRWFPAYNISLHICLLTLKNLHLSTQRIELVTSCLHQLVTELREVNMARKISFICRGRSQKLEC